MTLPPHRQARHDQLQAATRETHQRMDWIAGLHPDSAATDGHRDPWVHDLADQLLKLIDTHQARWCPHLAGGSAQPMHAAAWLPGIIACDLCVALGIFGVEGQADRICDRCGTDTLGQGIHTGQASIGPIEISYGACEACFAAIKTSMQEAPDA